MRPRSATRDEPAPSGEGGVVEGLHPVKFLDSPGEVPEARRVDFPESLGRPRGRRGRTS